MDLPKDIAQELLESKSRRNFLKATGSLAAVVGIASGQLDSSSQGNLTGGAAMLEEAYQVGPRQWIGPDNAKANVEAKTGRKYEAVDTEVEYYGEGGNWQGPLGIGSETKSVPAVHAEELNSIRYLSPSDSTADFQTAIDAVSDTDSPGTGQKLYVLRGHDYFGGTIKLNDGTRLVGEGMRGTVLGLADGADANLIGYTADDATDDRDFFAGLHDLKLDGNKANNVSGHGVYIAGPNSQEPNDWHMERVFIHQFAGDGFHADFSWGYHIDHVLSETCDGYGILISGGAQNYLSDIFTAYHSDTGLRFKAQRSTLSAINSRGNGTHGFSIGNQSNRVSDIQAVNNDRNGVVLNGTDHIVQGVLSENNGQSGTNGAQRGVLITGDDIAVSGVMSRDRQTTATQMAGVRLTGTRARVSNAVVGGNGENGVILASGATDAHLSHIVARNNSNYGVITYSSGAVIENVIASGNGIDDLRIEANDCIIQNCSYGTITDNGARTVINGRSAQSATPGSGTTGDDWGGNEARAYDLDVTVEDRSVTAPYDQYKADSAGNWVQIG